MNVFELYAKIGLDSTDFTSGLKKVGKLAGTALVGATAAVGAFSVASVKTGMKFDKSMSQVAATMGKTVDELQNEVGTAETSFGHFEGNLREFAQFMGKNTAFSASEAADALNYMALAGYDAQQSMDMLPNVLSLAAAGSMDLARASDMVTDTQTAFGISADRTTQMVDEMAKAASTGNTSVEQLGDAFLTVGGLAQELNGGVVKMSDGTKSSVDGVQELEIALTAMANAGVKGSEAGTHMRNMLLKLSSPTSDGTKQLEKLGVSVFDAEGNMRSLHDILGDLNGSLGKLTQEQKIQAISDLFNTRDLASAEALLGAVGSDWDEIGESILDADGAAAKMADTQLDNLAGDITLFKSALEGAQIALSDKMTGSLRDFIQLGTEGLGKVTDAFQKNGLTGAMEAFGEVLADGVNMFIDKLPKMIDASVGLINAFADGVAQNAPMIVDAIVTSLQKIIPALVKAGSNLLGSAFKAIFSNPKALFATVTLFGLKLGKTLIGSFGKALSGGGGLTSVLGNTLGGGSAAGDAVMGGGKGLLTGLLGDPKNAAKGIGSLAIVVGGITALVTAYGALSKIPHFKEFIADGGTMLKQVFDAIKQIATPQTAAIFAGVEIFGAVGVGPALSGIAAVGALLGGLTVLISAYGALNKIPGIQEFMQGGGELLATIMEQVGKVAGAFAKGLAVEVTSALPEIGANLAGFANNVKPFFDMAAGADFSGMEGFASGLMALVGADVVNKLESLFGSGLDFGAIGEQLSAFSEAMVGFFASAQEAGDTSAGIKLMEASGHITELVEATKNWEAGWGEADLEGLGNALAKYAAAIIPFFQKAGEIGDTSAGIKLMGVSGKIKSLLSAAKTKGQIGTKSMTDLANALVEYAKGMKKYFEETAGITDMKNGLSLAEQSGALNGLINAAKDYEAGTLVTLGNDLATFSSMFKSFSENMAGDNKLDVTPIINQVSKLTSGVSSKGESFSKAISSMGKGAKNALNGIKNTFSNSASSIAKAADFSGKVKSAMGKVNSALKSAKGTISQNLNAISSTFSKTKFDFTQHIAVPHFSMSGEFNAKKKTTPTVNTKWYAKAMEQPYLFDTPTFFGAGERGDEILYGKNSLMKDIKDAVKGANGGNVVINLNYDASADANDMLRDLARGLNRYKMAGVI